jgi:hypothetical protein
METAFLVRDGMSGVDVLGPAADFILPPGSQAKGRRLRVLLQIPHLFRCGICELYRDSLAQAIVPVPGANRDGYCILVA